MDRHVITLATMHTKQHARVCGQSQLAPIKHRACVAVHVGAVTESHIGIPTVGEVCGDCAILRVGLQGGVIAMKSQQLNKPEGGAPSLKTSFSSRVSIIVVVETSHAGHGPIKSEPREATTLSQLYRAKMRHWSGT